MAALKQASAAEIRLFACRRRCDGGRATIEDYRLWHETGRSLVSVVPKLQMPCKERVDMIHVGSADARWNRAVLVLVDRRTLDQSNQALVSYNAGIGDFNDSLSAQAPQRMRPSSGARR